MVTGAVQLVLSKLIMPAGVELQHSGTHASIVMEEHHQMLQVMLALFNVEMVERIHLKSVMIMIQEEAMVAQELVQLRLVTFAQGVQRQPQTPAHIVQGEHHPMMLKIPASKLVVMEENMPQRNVTMEILEMEMVVMLSALSSTCGSVLEVRLQMQILVLIVE